MDSPIPQPTLYTAIAVLGGAVVYMFHLFVEHHKQAMSETRLERAEARKAFEDLAAAIDRNTKAVAQLMMTMFFLPPEFKRNAETTLRELSEAERNRERKE